jgi:NADH-quinone oxidoreductase subunit G
MYSWVRNNEILRNTPRFNPEVNNYWMCDAGRLNTFEHVNSPKRIKSPLIRKGEERIETGWDEAIAFAASGLKAFRKGEMAVLGSAFATNEENYVARRFASEVLGTRHIDFVRHVAEGDEDEILIRADKTPNGRGALAVGIAPREKGSSFDEMRNAINDGRIKALYALDDNIAAIPGLAPILEKLEFLVVHSSIENETTALADVVLACSTYAEKNGTFTNFEGMVQRIRPSVAVLELDRSLDGFAMSRLDRFGTQFDRWARGSRRDARSSWRILVTLANAMGKKYRFNTSEEVFNEIVSTIPSFKGMSYRKLGNRGMKLATSKEPVKEVAG